MTTLRVFIKWAENIDAVRPNLHEKVSVPNLDRGEGERDKKISPEEAFDILDYLRKYERATAPHVLFELMWHTAARVGELQALDLEDFHSQDSYIEIVHRPRGGTPLKNKDGGQRYVGLRENITGLVSEYIRNHRINTTDDHDREPLFTTKHGRPNKTTLRNWIYSVTQPCSHTDCPEDRDPMDCKATQYKHLAKCPANYNPHAIRRGSLTYHLLRGWSKDDVGARANVTADVLEKHYDRRTNKEKLDRRRSNVEKL
jgi:integrase